MRFSKEAITRGSSGLSGRAYQRGVTLVIALIALVVLLFSGVALVRSFEASTKLAGSIAFKRDMINQAERGLALGIAYVSAQVVAGSNMATSNLAANYSSTVLSSTLSARGIPNVLIDDSLFATQGGAASNDIVDNAAGSSGVTIRYVIDRQCTDPDEYNTEHCAVMRAGIQEPGRQHHEGDKGKADVESMPVYRISVRVTGPNDTRAYAQTTISPVKL